MTTPDRSEGDVNLGEERQRWYREAIDDETRALIDRDAAVFLHQSLSSPCLDALRGSEGSTLYTEDGRELLDFHGNSVHQVGHGHPAVIEAVTRQLREMPFCPRRYTNRTAIELAERLVALAPGNLGKVLFAPGGTAAISMALKLARVATGRFKTISWWGSFHGAGLDAISIGGEHLFRKHMGPLMPGAIHVPPPDAGTREHSDGLRALGDPDYVEYVMRHEGDIGAVIAEPLRWTTVAQIPTDYWPRVRQHCDRHGALLIFDEIPLCLGRTGHLFATETTGVVPDMLCLGKGLGGGIMPLAALIARSDLDVADDVALGHYTHEKSPVACAAALATLDVIEKEGLVERSRTLGQLAAERLEQCATGHPILGEVRHQGLILGIDVVDPTTGEADEARAERMLYACLRRGLSFKTGGHTLVLAPPLVISEAELMRAIDILDDAADEVGQPG